MFRSFKLTQVVASSKGMVSSTDCVSESENDCRLGDIQQAAVLPLIRKLSTSKVFQYMKLIPVALFYAKNKKTKSLAMLDILVDLSKCVVLLL